MAQIQIGSKEAVKELNIIINNFNKLREKITGVGDGSKVSYRKMTTAIKGLKKEQEEMLLTLIKYDKALRNTSKSQKSHVTQVRNLKKSLSQTNLELDKANAKLNNLKNKKQVFGGIRKGILSIVSAFGVLAGVQLFASAVKNAFELTKRLDSLQFAMKAVITDVRELGQTTEWLNRITENFGAEIITTTNRYIKFRAAAKQANLSADETQKIFGTMTKAAGVLGLKTDELTGIYLALEQMISKGKITTEELRRQLGERLPGAMDIMANSIGVTTAELDDMLKKGEVISKDVLPGFAVEVEKAFGLKSVTRVETLQAATIRLKNAFTNMVQEFNEVNGASSILRKSFDFLAENLQLIVKIGLALGGVWAAYRVSVLAASIANSVLTGIKSVLISVTTKLSRVTGVEAVFTQASTAATATNTAAKATNVVATTTLSAVTKELTFQLKLLWLAMISNPITALLAVIGLAVAAYLVFKKSVLETTQEIQDYNKEVVESAKVDSEKIQSISGLIDKYDELKNKLKDLNEDSTEAKIIQKELSDVIKQLGKAVPISVDGVNQYGEALGLNTPLLERWVELEKERLGLLSKKTEVEELKNLDEATQRLDEIKGLREGINSATITGIGLLKTVNGQLVKIEQFGGGKTNITKKVPLTDDDILLLNTYEADWLKVQDTAIKTTEEIQKANKLAQEGPEERKLREEAKQALEDLSDAKKESIEESRKTSAAAIKEEIKQLEDLKKAREAPVNAGLSDDEKVDFVAALNKETQEDINKLQAKYNKIMGVTTTSTSKQVKELRKIRDLQNEINNIENKKKLIEFDIIANDEDANFEDREKAIQDSIDMQKKIEQLAAEDKIEIQEARYQKEVVIAEKEIKLAETTAERKAELRNFIDGLGDENEQKKDIISDESALKEFEIEKTKVDRLKALQSEYEQFVVKQTENLYSNRAISAKNAYNAEVFLANLSIKKAEEEFKASDKGFGAKRKREKAYAKAKEVEQNAAIELAKELGLIEFQMTNETIDYKLRLLEIEYESLSTSEKRRKEIIALMNALEKSRPDASLTPDPSDADKWKEHFDEILDMAKKWSSAIGDLGNAIFDNNIENLEAEIEAITNNFDKQIELAEGHSELQKNLEEQKQIKLKELEKKRLKEEQKKAKFKKAQALVDIAINTAVAVSAAPKDGVFGLAIVPILIALGALQAAAVLAQPIPKYKDGLELAKTDHIGVINDGGEQEFVERNGNILTTDVKNAIIPIEKGDTIYKNYDDLERKSLLMNGATNGLQVNRIEFGNIWNGLDDSIQKGFRKAKINNTIINKIKDNRYAESMSSWN